MLFELAMIPVGTDRSMSDEIADVLRVIDESGLPYELNAAGTVIEGDWDEVMPVIHAAHQAMRQKTPHVITSIRIEDEAGETNQMRTNMTRVEEKLGKPARRTA